MANPQKENGFTAIANEILDHLCFLSLSDYESRITHAIFRLTYGWGKKSDIISINQLSSMTKIKSPNVVRTIRNLTDRHIINAKHLNHFTVEYSFQKNYELWDIKSDLDLILESQVLSTEIVSKQIVSPQTVSNEIVSQPIVSNEIVSKQIVSKQITDSISTDNKIVSLQIDTKENINKDTKEIIPKEIPVFVLPEWVDRNIWDAYLEMRKKKKVPPTEHAKNLIIKELVKLKESGNSPNDVLEQSIRNGWTDVYNIKGNGNNGHKENENIIKSRYKYVN